MNLVLNFTFLLVLLSKFIDCSGLSPSFHDALVSIRREHALPGADFNRPIPSLENDQEFAVFLGAMDLEGMKKVIEQLIEARVRGELDDTFLEKLMRASIQTGNIQVIQFLRSRNRYTSIPFIGSQPLLLMALELDHGPIFCHLYSTETRRPSAVAKISEAVVNNPNMNIVKTMLEWGLLDRIYCREILMKCLETGNDDVIDMILNAETHMNPYGEKLLTYPQSIQEGFMRGYEKVFIKAAECGNMKVVKYFFDIGAIDKRAYMEAALEEAIANNHEEIADLIRSKM